MPVMSTKQYRTTTTFVGKRPICTIEPLDTEAKVHIVYFHGGGYSMEATGLHFQLMKNLVKQTGCALTYIDYPLAPEHTVTDSMAVSLAAYKKLLAENSKHRFILMGDSAGGGLALALAMGIRDEGIADPGLAQPEQIILFSPWLDIALTNKRIPEFEKRDVILDVTALREIGERYRGDVPADNYMVSPKYGVLSGLGAISVFYGTEEIFFPDCQEFCDEKQNGGFPVNGYEYQGMQHDWVILPIEEAKRVLVEVVALIAIGDRSKI
jgi:epsilon-lactone hydrolase